LPLAVGWLIGMNATQALSIASGRKGVLSLGRVQTPTLAMICARYLENKSFVPEIYFQVAIQVDKDGQVFKAVSVKNFKTEADAQAIMDKVEDVAGGFPAGGHILSVEAKPRKEPPPLLHDLSSMQQEGNKRKGFTADRTLEILQSLYEAKLVTYPRTGSRYIGDDVFAGVPALINIFKNHNQFGKQATALSGAKLSRRSVNAKKVTDHHAILPTGEIPGHLSDDHWAIYDMVAGRMLEAFHQDCIKEITKITVESGSKFLASGTVIRTAGWRACFR
jgi:DNA topoisomerase-3